MTAHVPERVTEGRMARFVCPACDWASDWAAALYTDHHGYAEAIRHCAAMTRAAAM